MQHVDLLPQVKIESDLSNIIQNTSISGVKFSWTTLSTLNEAETSSNHSQVVSSTCVTRIGDAVKWLSCPRDATGFANSLAELHNDLETVSERLNRRTILWS